MKILAHRGVWFNKNEQNTIKAFNRAFKLNCGIELDVRDYKGDIVVSHDIATETSVRLTEVIKNIASLREPIAINIKSDGIIKQCNDILQNTNLKWFFFDMSFPESFICFKHKYPYYHRISEFENETKILDYASGIWLDSFNTTWFSRDIVKNFLNLKKEVCVVSSECHQRDYKDLWKLLLPLRGYEDLSICTDFPELARTYFDEK